MTDDRGDDEIDLSGRLRRAQEALALIRARPRDQPLRLSLKRVKNMVPSEVVNLCLVLERVQTLGFAAVELIPPDPNFIGVYLWRIGFFDWFPQYRPPPPKRGLGQRKAEDRLIELQRFTDLAGILDLRDRLPAVLSASPTADDVPGGTKTLRRVANTVYELAENTLAHSRRLDRGEPIVGYYLAQRMPNQGKTFVAVGDAGNGIPATMRARFPDLTDDLTALRQALEPGASSDDGGGNGLYLARTAAHEIAGSTITVESGAALLRLRENGTEEARVYGGAERLTRVSFMFRL